MECNNVVFLYSQKIICCDNLFFLDEKINYNSSRIIKISIYVFFAGISSRCIGPPQKMKFSYRKIPTFLHSKASYFLPFRQLCRTGNPAYPKLSGRGAGQECGLLKQWHYRLNSRMGDSVSIVNTKRRLNFPPHSSAVIIMTLPNIVT